MTTKQQVRPVAVFLAGILGTAGVALAAAATHTGATQLLGNASAMCLAHAPVLLALYVGWERIRTAMPAALILGFGVLVFAGDLVARQFTGSGLFPMAAPIGGVAMIIGWLTVTAAAFFKGS